jgi:protocatechuate 3,4-dioxygenase beta subunit
MDELSQTLNRRHILKSSLGLFAGLGGAKAIAQLCQGQTADQPLGPFFPRTGTPTLPVREDQNPRTPIYLANDNDLTQVKGVSGKASGQVVYVRGRVLDRDCRPVENASVIIWQASESGRYNHTGDAANIDFRHPQNGVVIRRVLDRQFQYWGKTATNDKGEYLFKTILPGFYPADLASGWYRPPQIHFLVSAPGAPQFVTQMYFRGEVLQDNAWIQELNSKDGLLQSDSMSEEQRQRLIVDFVREPLGPFADAPIGIFDIYL